MFEQYLTKTGKLSSKQPQQVKNLWYINKFKEKHGDTYDYTKTQYVRSRDHVVVTCRVHGDFYPTPHDHLKGTGCPKCQGNVLKTTKQCIQDFRQVHGSTYQYSAVVYVNRRTEVLIICPEHGVFHQTPNHHLKGHGCPKCSVQNQNILYVFRCENTGLIKIGITNNIKNRLANIGGSLQYIHHITVDSPRNLEKQLHKKYQAYNEFNPTVNNGGTEFFKLIDQQLYELIQYLNSF